jgi:hypothetical protein
MEGFHCFNADVCTEEGLTVQRQKFPRANGRGVSEQFLRSLELSEHSAVGAAHFDGRDVRTVDHLEPEDYYQLLDAGFRIPLTNGSDHPARIVGCARAYVKVDNEFSYARWIEGIRKGRTFVTSGPLLFLDGIAALETMQK